MNPPIRREVRVRCSIEHAFTVFTSRIDLWWPHTHRRSERAAIVMESGVGGRFYQRDESGEESRLGEVTVWDPPARVTYTWYPGAITGPTQVDVEFTSEGDHTIVHVTHAEGEANMGGEWSGRVEKFERAWGDVLPAFAQYITTEQGG